MIGNAKQEHNPLNFGELGWQDLRMADAYADTYVDTFLDSASADAEEDRLGSTSVSFPFNFNPKAQVFQHLTRHSDFPNRTCVSLWLCPLACQRRIHSIHLPSIAAMLMRTSMRSLMVAQNRLRTMILTLPWLFLNLCQRVDCAVNIAKWSHSPKMCLFLEDPIGAHPVGGSPTPEPIPTGGERMENEPHVPTTPMGNAIPVPFTPHHECATPTPTTVENPAEGVPGNHHDPNEAMVASPESKHDHEAMVASPKSHHDLMVASPESQHDPNEAMVAALESKHDSNEAMVAALESKRDSSEAMEASPERKHEPNEAMVAPIPPLLQAKPKARPNLKRLPEKSQTGSSKPAKPVKKQTKKASPKPKTSPKSKKTTKATAGTRARPPKDEVQAKMHSVLQLIYLNS